MLHLGEYLSSNPHLEILDISGNEITDKGIETFSYYLCADFMLQELRISHIKGITDSSIPILTSMIESSRIGILSVGGTIPDGRRLLFPQLLENQIRYGFHNINLSGK